jgi:LSD1 subclass zinc finger protein
METVSGLNVNVKGSTVLSSSIAEEFQDVIVTFDKGASPMGYEVKEMKCPRCGSSLDYTVNSRFVKCSFCGSILLVNELRR